MVRLERCFNKEDICAQIIVVQLKRLTMFAKNVVSRLSMVTPKNVVRIPHGSVNIVIGPLVMGVVDE